MLFQRVSFWAVIIVSLAYLAFPSSSQPLPLSLVAWNDIGLA